ncbi:MAG: endonuclease/exonuclease/phosphatase family protein [Fimbriimonadales bacterium]|nr:endonuclease/exonuclease/phosphatase family protein [Fimbriimonadales bacterium]
MSLRVATFNIRLGTVDDGEHSWPARARSAAAAIRALDADLVGLQEAYRFQLEDLEPLLEEWDWIGVGREDGFQKGEHAAWLYRRNRVTIASWGTFWFSEDPDEPGSVSWGTACTRSCTWARVALLSDGRPILVYNLHWDHASTLARRQSAKVLAGRIPVGEACIVVGDFNAGPEDPEVRDLTDPERHPALTDAAPDVCRSGSWHDFTGRAKGPRIDHILASSHLQPVASGAITERVHGLWPSDHFPIWSQFVWR